MGGTSGFHGVPWISRKWLKMENDRLQSFDWEQGTQVTCRALFCDIIKVFVMVYNLLNLIYCRNKCENYNQTVQRVWIKHTYLARAEFLFNSKQIFKITHNKCLCTEIHIVRYTWNELTNMLYHLKKMYTLTTPNLKCFDS